MFNSQGHDCYYNSTVKGHVTGRGAVLITKYGYSVYISGVDLHLHILYNSPHFSDLEVLRYQHPENAFDL